MLVVAGDETNGGKKTGSGRNDRNISTLLENLQDGGVDMDAVLGSVKFFFNLNFIYSFLFFSFLLWMWTLC
jgi:hypothetical protein